MLKKFSVLFFLLCLSSLAFAQDEQERWTKWETDADTLMNHQDFAGAAALYSKIISECKFQDLIIDLSTSVL